MSIKLRQTGDTIVEVLIVIVVMGVVVSAGYGIAIRSLQSTQLAQEKGYALKLAESQLERLKAAAAADPAILTKTNGFCVDDSLAAQDIANPSPTPTVASENYANYPAACKKDPNNANCASYCYHLSIKKVTDDAFTTSVRWDGPRGTRQQIQLSYRLYQ